MTLWIVGGLPVLAVLGLVCAWVLRAHSGLEAGHLSDSPQNERIDVPG